MQPQTDHIIPSFSLARKFGAGFGVAVACVSMVAVVIMLNYLAARHFVRFDCSSLKRTQLSPMTLRVLESVTNEIKVVVYYDPEERLYKQSLDLLKEYAARNSRIKIQLVNPVSNPAEAQIIRNQYKLAAINEKHLIIFDCNGKTKSVYQSALSEYELEQVANPNEREFRRKSKSFRGELEFTSALVTVSNPRQLKAYFLQGHGEHNPASTEEQAGYSKFTALLAENNIQPEFLSLLGSGEVPADCSLLVVPGPSDAITREELDKIERYLNQGGRLFVLFSYRSFGKRIGLESLLAGWGVMVGESAVLDPLRSTPNARSLDMVLMINETEGHPITRPLFQSSLHLLTPHPVSTIRSRTGTTDNLHVDELLRTTSEGVLVSTFRKGVPEVNPARDPRGVFSLIVAVEKGAVKDVSAARGNTRIVVAGDSMFLGNQMIESAANRDFAAHAFNWLVDRTYLLGGLSPRPVSEYKLNLTRGQLITVRWLLLGALPATAVFVGGLVWLRRRR